jgi:tetratricopeptide (TPR) repeat protein
MNQNEALEYKYSGNNNFNKGNYDQAIADCTQAIRLNPNDAEVYVTRGAAYICIWELRKDMRKDTSPLDQAINDLDRGLKLNPDFADAYTIRGSAYNLKGEHDRAIEDHNRAIQLNSEDCNAYFKRGCIYIQHKGEYDRGIKDLETALRINPDHPYARRFIEMARMMQKSGMKF